jgi:hypothetical protein
MMKHLHRISTIAFAAILSLTALMGLVNVAQAQDVPMAPEITASISGVVYSAAGQPLADIEVSVLRRGPGGWWSTLKTTRTDAAGAYTLGYLNTGIYRLGFRDTHEEFLPAYHPAAANVEGAIDIPVAGVDITGLQTYLRPALKITGRVTDDVGQPLPELDVSAYQQDNEAHWSSVRTVRTDASGVYTLTYLHPATYRLGFRDARERVIPQFHPDAQDVESAQDIHASEANVTGIQTTLQRSAQITGAVTFWGGVQPGQATVTVYMQKSSEWQSVKSEYLYGYSNPEMRYRIFGLPPARYRIGVRGYYNDGSITNSYEEFYDDATTIHEADDLHLGVGHVLTDVNFVLGDNQSLSTLNGVVTAPDGSGLPNIIVTTYFSDTQGWREIRQTRTITDGMYSVRSLEAGNYAVRFHDPQRNFTTEYYNDATEISAATIISVTDRSDLNGIDVKLTPNGRIVAAVTLYDGRHPQSAEIKAYSASSGYTGLAASQYVDNGSGRPLTLTLTGLFPGAYRLYLAARDWNNSYSEYYDNTLLIEDAIDVTVLSGGTTEIQAVLGENPGYAQIIGTVRSRESTPLPNVKVTAFYQESPGSYYWTPRQSTFTDQAGNYSLWALRPDTYIVLFDDPDGAYIARYFGDATNQQSATQLRLEVAQTITGIDVMLPQTGMLTGTVTLYDGRPPLSGYVTLYRWHVSELPYPGEWISVKSQPLTPNYRFIQVPTGDYRVGVTASFGDGEYYRQQFFPAAAKIDDAQNIHVEQGMTTANIDFVFGDDQRDARIEGQVYVDGLALPGMQIDLYTEGSYGEWWRLVYVQTDAAGAFRIDGLGAGEYRICVVDPAQVRETICYPGAGGVEGASSLQLADGQVISDLRIEMALFQHWSYLPIIGR